jgi:hypothetical protein
LRQSDQQDPDRKPAYRWPAGAIDSTNINRIAATGTSVRQLEKKIVAKSGGAADCEDVVGLGRHYAYVIDGSTSTRPAQWDGESGGRFAAMALSRAVDHLDPQCDAAGAARLLTASLAEEYRTRGVLQRALESTPDRPSAALAIFSRHRRQVWLVGDCRCLLLAQGQPAMELSDPSEAENALALARALVLQCELQRGATIAELRQSDPGRAYIVPLLHSIRSLRNERSSQRHGFAAFDGVTIPEILTFDVPEDVDQVVLATDGYPQLCDTLGESEQKLRERIQSDPLLMHDPPMTKGVRPGHVSFDDRAYLRIGIPRHRPSGGVRLPHTETAVPDLSQLPLAQNAHWVEYGTFSLAGIDVQSAYEPGEPPYSETIEKRVGTIARAIAESKIEGVFDAPRYALVGTRQLTADADSERPRLELRFRDSTYSAFLATVGWDKARLAGVNDPELRVDRRPEMRELDLHNFLAGGFATCLGACLMVVLRNGGHPVTYLSLRRSGILAGYWDGSIDEGLRRASLQKPFDQRSPEDPTPDLDAFLRRAVREEAGIHELDAEPIIASVGHDTWSLQPALVGFVEVDMTLKLFQEHLRIASGREEFVELRWVPLETADVWETIDELKRRGRLLPWVEIGLYGTLIAYHAQHGHQLTPILREFSAAGRGWPGQGATR